MKIVLLVAAFLIVPLSAASAQTGPKPISRDTYMKLVDNRFNSVDTNHDGVISREEGAAQQQRDIQKGRSYLTDKLTAQFRQLDTNKDGQLSLQEFTAQVASVRTSETSDQLIARLDTNHDGKISAAEFRAPELAKFDRADANHDGIVTPAEIQGANKK